MSRGNIKNEGNKGRNIPYQLSTLEGLQQIANNTNGVVGNLISILNAVKAHQDMEILLVRDTGNADLIIQQIREYDETTQTWTTTYADISGAPYVPVGPLEYLDASAVLALILAELLDQGLTLDSISTDTTSISSSTSSIDAKIIVDTDDGIVATDQDLPLNMAILYAEGDGVNVRLTTDNTPQRRLKVQLDSIPLATDAATETTQLLIKALLTTIDADTSNLDVALSTRNAEATQLLIKALLTTIDADTSNLDVLLSTRNAEATQLLIKALLTTIDADTSNLDVLLSTRNVETTQLLVKALLTTIDADTSNLDVLLSTRATEATLANVLTTTAFQARINTLGQKLMAASTPVVLASDQSAIPISLSSVAHTTSLTRVASSGPGANVPAGAFSIEFFNAGNTTCTVGGANVLPGERVPYQADTRNTLPSITYSAGIGSDLVIKVII